MLDYVLKKPPTQAAVANARLITRHIDNCGEVCVPSVHTLREMVDMINAYAVGLQETDLMSDFQNLQRLMDDLFNVDQVSIRMCTEE